MRPTRRALLKSALAGSAALALPRPARASVVSAADRKFVFVFAAGGWDPTMTIADCLDNPSLDVEEGTARGTAGNLSFVDSEQRPSVAAYLNQYGERTVLINGLQLATISHEVGHALIMTGGRDGLDPDWGCVLGASQADRYPAPLLVICGPCYSGALGGSVLRCGVTGQLGALISGSLVAEAGQRPLYTDLRDPIDAYVAARSARRVRTATDAGDQAQALAFQRALARSAIVRATGRDLDLAPVETLVDGASVVAEVLGAGLSRCITIAGPPTFVREWDTHVDNFALQSVLWEDLFAGLLALNGALDATPGTVGETLADETVVVVISELGRNPRCNNFDGKDHWPFTSVMVSGSGVAGGRVIGGHSDQFEGLPVDYATGETTADGQLMSAGAVGGALLMLGDVDPGDWIDDADPLTALLA